MFSRNNSGRDLFSRNVENGSERWSQPLEDSQDWGSQIFLSQEQQRPQLRGQHLGLLSGSQGMTRGSLQGRGGIRTSTPPPSDRELTLARDIRFGLHTIITVMRELPDQLREVSAQVVRASQQPEETNRLVKDTSERLQALVTGLEAKLDLLLENKENLEGVKETVMQNGQQVATIVNYFEQECVRDEKQAQELAKLEELFESTRKDIRREIRKLREFLQDGENSRIMTASLKKMENDLGKLAETLKSGMAKTQAEFGEQQKSLDNQLEMFFSQTTQELQQMKGIVKNLTEQLASLPKDIAIKVQQAVKEVLQQSPMGNVGNFISPVQRGLPAHRPMLPFGEGVHRSQVSPVAQVHPQRNTITLPPDPCQEPHSRNVATHRVLQTRMATSPTLGTVHHRGIPEKRRAIETEDPVMVRRRGQWLQEENSKAPFQSCQHSKAFVNPTNVGKPLLEKNTQHFTPETTISSVDSPEQNTLVLEYDSSSSGDSPIPGQRVDIRFRRSDDWIEQSVIEIPKTEPPNKNKPVMAITHHPTTGTYLGGGCERDVFEDTSASHPKDTFFPKPAVPLSAKRRKDECLQEEAKPCNLVTPITGNSFRMRRFLTPQENQGFKLKLSRRTRKNSA